MIASLIVVAQLAGVIPPGVPGLSAVVWLPAASAPPASCDIPSPTRWECRELAQEARGVIVFVGSGTIASQIIGTSTDAALHVSRWGRLVTVSPGAVVNDETTDVHVTVWKPARARFRTRVLRFPRTEEAAVRCVSVSGSAFWISGDEFDPDAFLQLEGAGIATTRVALSSIADGPLDQPWIVDAELPRELVGRIVTRRGDDVEGAEVELFTPLSPVTSAKEDLASLPMIRSESTHSALDGTFTFRNLSSGPFLVAVTDATFGRGSAIVKQLGEPLTVRLTPPVRAEGRVLRSRVPVAGARVRFIPSMSALLASTDPKQLSSEERYSDEDGRFSLPLPPVSAGEIQVVGPDGTSVRVGVPDQRGEPRINIGDITLPEHRRLTIRLLDETPCALAVAGPVGRLGMTIVDAAGWSNVFSIDVPEPGDWILEVKCSGRSFSVEPGVVVVPADGPDQTVDVRLKGPTSNFEQ